MAGAYVGIAPATTPWPGPPEWDISWPWPSPDEWDWNGQLPYPPGYSPDYSLDITANDTITLDSTYEISILLHDHDTYKTARPKDTDKIQWSAKIDGEIIALKFDGDAEYDDIIESLYSDQGSSFWGAAPTVRFSTSESDIGKTIVLTALSEDIFGYDVTTTKSIVVTGESNITYTLTINWVGTVTSRYIGGQLGEYGQSVPYCFYNNVGFISGNIYPTLVTITASSPIVFNIADYGFYVSLLNSTFLASGVSIQATFNKYINGELSATYTKTQAGNGSTIDITWLAVGIHGEITVINP